MPNRGRGGRGGGGEREERAEGVRRREEVCITANIKNVGQPTGKISLSLLNTSNLVIAPPPPSIYGTFPSSKITTSTAEFPDSVNFTEEFSRLLQAYIRFVKNLPIFYLHGGP